jgi:hypothetical protein
MHIPKILILVLFATGAGAAEEAVRPSSDTTRFDGVWSVTVVCADYKDASVGAKGYTVRMLAEIKNGRLNAQRGNPGEPGSLHYSGRIDADGAADLQAKGFTGNPEYTPGRLVNATPYAYRLKGHFDERRGSAKRLDTRICDANFVKQ